MMSVPCIFYGAGVSPSWFDAKSVGSHIQIAGTLAEILGPEGFTYASLQPSMFDGDAAFNQRLYASNGEITVRGKNPENTKKYIADMRKLAAWRVIKGNSIEE